MRKFLALVLAMLMVSASALSVSAAFADQSAVDAHDYAAAIEELYDLGVIAGKEDANGNVAFDPEGTLTREEAAVVAAKLIAGSKQTIDWSAATTCRFTDVTAKWSFGYIEYAADRSVLDGIGDGKYNPKGTLDVASAVAIVVKALGLRSQVAYRDSIAKPSVWYLNWIEVAEEYDLLEGVNPFSYTQTCTRAMMAQLAFNALYTEEIANNKLLEGFSNQKTTVTGMLTEATADGVVVTVTLGNGTETKTFDTAAFNAALDGVTAADLVNCKVKVKYNATTNKITDVDVLTSVLTFNYTDGKLAIVKDKNNKNTIKITLDGKTYVVGETTDSDTNNNAGIGSGTTTTNTIIVNVDGVTLVDNKGNDDATDDVCKNLPNYYAGIAYDDNNDGVYDRVAVDTYRLATIEKKSEGKLGTTNNKAATYAITLFGQSEAAFTTGTKSGNTYYALYETAFVGANAVMDKETPVLLAWKTNAEGTTSKPAVATVSVLGSAEKVTGVLAGYSSSDKYVTIGATKYPFAKDDAVTTPDNWTLNQTVTAYAYNGAYVCLASESSSAQSVVIDRVTIDANGKAVITGFDVLNYFAPVTVTVDGIVNDKIIAMGAKQDYKTAGDADSGLKAVEIGQKVNNEWTTSYVLNEGYIASLTKTTDGVYVSAVTEWNLNTTVAVNKVDANYIYTGTTANYYNDKTTVVAIKAATDAKDPYSQTYVTAKTVDFSSLDASDVQAVVLTKNNVNAEICNTSHTHSASCKNSVALVVYKNGMPAVKAVKTALDAGTSIAQIVDSFETAYSTTKYNAIDLLTGAEVELVSSISNLTSKAFYEYNTADKTVVAKSYADTTKWVGTFNITVESSGSGLAATSTIKAMAVKLVEATAGEGDYAADQAGYDATKAVKLTDVTVYVLNNGLIDDADNDGKLDTGKATDLTSGSYTCYIMGNKLIVLQ